MSWPTDMSETDRISTLTGMAQVIILASAGSLESILASESLDVFLDHLDDLREYRDGFISVSITPFPVQVFDENEQATVTEWFRRVTVHDLAQGDPYGTKGIVLDAVVSLSSGFSELQFEREWVRISA